MMNNALGMYLFSEMAISSFLMQSSIVFKCDPKKAWQKKPFTLLVSLVSFSEIRPRWSLEASRPHFIYFML